MSPDFYDDLSPDSVENLSSDEIAFFAEDPTRLALLTSRETRNNTMLLRVFIGALIFIAGSKLITFQYGDLFSQFINDVVVDTVFELGAALLGAVSTVFFIEREQKRQFVENTEIRRKIELRIERELS